MAGRLAGKVALVTGGANGMGAAIARLFAAEGAAVAVVDLDDASGSAVADGIRSAGGRAIAVRTDVTDADSVAQAVAATEAAFGPVTVLVNHAGGIVVKPFLETTEAEWDGLHALNVRSMFLVTRAVLPGMIAAGGGAIVCTSSISAVAATPMEVLYDTTKGACHMFARAIAVEFRDRGIRCNAICPGFVRTGHGLKEIDLLNRYGVDVSEAAIQAQQGRLGEPEDIARAALFLASDDADFITGTHLFADNGFTAI
ncbi:SDR family NAD(P)-dependent oxidoreductase [Tabrizicola sp. YIM 78059]|uniref:SDR family NAD(P)-dependent oxidoreductase n=1 Tax=Tabrizicola sp. YIM 78059 TaxID=2529861 RepID=UPI0010AB06A1|nr:SDR family oxidoreductase [Tabrizicola sp. YIM 78059]